MTIFVDASALVSIATGESDAVDLATILESGDVRLCSPISLWETVSALRRTFSFSVESARDRVDAFRALFGLRSVDIGEGEYRLALGAYARFGKGRHPAALNMGDCFAYACAKTHHADLLFKGDDFVKTDIRVASKR